MGCGAGVHTAAILIESHIAYPVQAVLDAPVVAVQFHGL